MHGWCVTPPPAFCGMCVRCCCCHPSRYGARFPTREGYTTVRLPYTAFRPEFQGQPPLDAALLAGVTIRWGVGSVFLGGGPGAGLGGRRVTLCGAPCMRFAVVVVVVVGRGAGIITIPCP